MRPFHAPDRFVERPRRPSRLPLLVFLLLVYAFVRLAGTPAPHRLERAVPKLETPAIVAVDPGEAPPVLPFPPLTGFRVHGSGSYLDLGDRKTQLPGSLLARFFPHPLVLPSCLTQLPPAFPLPGQPPPKLRPIRDDWPGFYGAPWTARLDDDLIALLHVYAPRSDRFPVPPPEFQLYPDYDGTQSAPAVSLLAPAIFVRGSKAVLYRAFLKPPLRCLDLVVQNGENNGIGHLYYERYHHYYETDTTFHIQP